MWVVAASVWTAPALASITLTCMTPGACSDFAVPQGVTSVTIEVWGAQGGAGGGFGTVCVAAATGGFGADVKATYGDIPPGTTLNLYVGARGGDGACGGDGGAGGNGGTGGNTGDTSGGSGGNGLDGGTGNLGGGGGGGGETDVRLGDSATSRIISAGGGGGAGASGGAGGYGGGPSGTAGDPNPGHTAAGGEPGTQALNGGGGTAATGDAGANATDPGSGGGGGGGGGLCGGQGGGAGPGDTGGAGGGGGSGFVVDDCGGNPAFSPTRVSSLNGVDPGNNGNGKIVITYTEPPQTGSPINVTATGATLVGYDENEDTYHFEYGTDTTYGTMTADAPSVSGQTIKVPITGLTPNTVYHYRIDSRDSPVQGNDVAFQTLLLPVTGGASGVTGTTATIQGTDPNAGESYHFEYGTTTSYGASSPTATNGGGTLSAGLTGLQPGATYHYRIVSDAGAGSDATFTTVGRPLTGPATAVTSTSAVLQGIDRNSGTSYHFEYGTSTAYGKSTAAASSSGTSSFVGATVSGLSPGMKYHFRIVDSAGGAGLDGTFTTVAAAGGGGGGGGSAPARDLILGLRGPASGKIGHALRYVATIGNIGTKSVRGVKLKLSFRGGSIKVTSVRGCKRSRSTLTCRLPKIAAGHAVRLKVVVRESKATVLSVRGNTLTRFKDPTPKNNRASTRTTVK